MMQRAVLAILVAVAFTPAYTGAAVYALPSVPAQDDPQDPPKDPPENPPMDPKRAEREKKAEALWEDAKALVAQGRWDQALIALRELRERHLFTMLYAKFRKEITESVYVCGNKVAAAGLQKQAIGKKAHLDTILGFQLNAPEGWRGIPNWQPIFGERDTSEANNRGQSYRCARYTSRWLETVYIDVYKTYGPGGVDQVVDGGTRLYNRDWLGLDDGATSSLPHPRYQAMRRVHKDGDDNRLAVYGFYDPATKKGFGIVGYWRTSAVAFGEIVLGGASKEAKAPPVEEKDWGLALKVFDQVARSFAIFDQGQLAQLRAANKGSPLSADGWIVQCADWKIHKTRNYVIEYSTREDFAKRLGQELENILALYQRLIPFQKRIAPGRVKLFDSEEDFGYYSIAGSGAAAYWSPMQREIVAYRWEGEKVKIGEQHEEMTVAQERNPEEVTFCIIYHEAFHQYMENLMGISRDVYVPSWLNEGMGDYFFGGRWKKDGSFEIGLNDWRLETIVAAVKEKKYVPLRRIFDYSQQAYYSNAGLCYAEGWSICYFFMSEEGRKAKYHLIPQIFYQELVKSGDHKKVNEKVFAQYDVAKMEEQWKAFVLGLEKHIPRKPEPKVDGTEGPGADKDKDKDGPRR